MTDEQFETLLRESIKEYGSSYIDSYEESSQTYEYSRKFERKIKRLTRQSSKWDIPKLKWTPKRAIVFIVMISLLAASTFETKANRNSILGFYVNSYTDYTVFEPIKSNTNNSIVNEYVITYDMSDYELYKQEKSKNNIITIYKGTSKNEKEILFKQMVDDTQVMSVYSSENATIKTITINSNKAIYWNQNNMLCILWKDNDYYLYLNGKGDVSEKTLLQIANSITEGCLK